MEFEWDEDKAATNLAKHGVSFAEAKTVFDDPLYVDFYDPDHSDNEQRTSSSASRKVGCCCSSRTRSEIIRFG